MVDCLEGCYNRVMCAFCGDRESSTNPARVLTNQVVSCPPLADHVNVAHLPMIVCLRMSVVRGLPIGVTLSSIPTSLLLSLDASEAVEGERWSSLDLRDRNAALPAMGSSCV